MRTPYIIKEIRNGYFAVFIEDKQLTGGILGEEQALQAIWTLEGSPKGFTFKILEDGVYKLEVLKNPIKLNRGVALYFADGFYFNEQLEKIGEQYV